MHPHQHSRAKSDSEQIFRSPGFQGNESTDGVYESGNTSITDQKRMGINDLSDFNSADELRFEQKYARHSTFSEFPSSVGVVVPYSLPPLILTPQPNIPTPKIPISVSEGTSWLQDLGLSRSSSSGSLKVYDSSASELNSSHGGRSETSSMISVDRGSNSSSKSYSKKKSRAKRRQYLENEKRYREEAGIMLEELDILVPDRPKDYATMCKLNEHIEFKNTINSMNEQANGGLRKRNKATRGKRSKKRDVLSKALNYIRWAQDKVQSLKTNSTTFPSLDISRKMNLSYKQPWPSLDQATLGGTLLPIPGSKKQNSLAVQCNARPVRLDTIESEADFEAEESYLSANEDRPMRDFKRPDPTLLFYNQSRSNTNELTDIVNKNPILEFNSNPSYDRSFPRRQTNEYYGNDLHPGLPFSNFSQSLYSRTIEADIEKVGPSLGHNPEETADQWLNEEELDSSME